MIARIAARGVNGDPASRLGCGFFAFMCAFACALALSLQAPASAFGWFNDVTDAYPASQEISAKGDVMTAADIPEGQYAITAETSSYMCKLTNVTLTSVDGQLWATFTISKAYTALYIGTAEEAASLTSEDGTDYSAYYVTDPVEGYVYRQFSLPIPALNSPFTLATFSGGTNGNVKGKWFTRTAIFYPSTEVERAVQEALNPSEPDPDPDPDPEPEPDPEPDPEPQPDPEPADDPRSGDADPVPDPSGSSEDPNPADSDADPDDGSDDPDDGDAKETTTKDPGMPARTPGDAQADAGNTGTAGYAPAGSGADTGAQAGDEANSKSADAADVKKGSKSKAAAKARARGAKVGTPISLVAPGDFELPEIKSTADPVESTVGKNALNKAAIAGGAVGVDAVLMAAFLVVMRRARPRVFPRM